jgi:hypothetical protein
MPFIGRICAGLKPREDTMSFVSTLMIASFTVPEKIDVNSQSMLWLLPLIAAIAIVYKATKMPKIKALNFCKEAAILFGSIVVFMAITAVALCVLAWLITE